MTDFVISAKEASQITRTSQMNKEEKDYERCLKMIKDMANMGRDFTYVYITKKYAKKLKRQGYTVKKDNSIKHLYKVSW